MAEHRVSRIVIVVHVLPETTDTVVRGWDLELWVSIYLPKWGGTGVTFAPSSESHSPLSKLGSRLPLPQWEPLGIITIWHQINQPPFNNYIHFVSNQPAPLQQLHPFRIKSTSPPWTITFISYQINQPPLNNYIYLVSNQPAPLKKYILLISNQPAPLEQVHSLVSNQPAPLKKVHSFGIKSTSTP